MIKEAIKDKDEKIRQLEIENKAQQCTINEAKNFREKIVKKYFTIIQEKDKEIKDLKCEHEKATNSITFRNEENKNLRNDKLIIMNENIQMKNEINKLNEQNAKMMIRSANTNENLFKSTK